MKKTIVIKIGTSAILDEKGDIDIGVIKNISRGISDVKKKNYQVVLVASGAVGAARKEFDAGELGKISKIELAQIRSAVGQSMLMEQFRHEFQKHNIPVAQCLVTRSDFSSRERQLSMRNIIHKMFLGGILPIVNENDFLTPEELDFSDNDQLAGFFAGTLRADCLILLSNVSGLYSCHPSEKNAQKIDVIKEITLEIERCVSQKKSKNGIGGMKSKIETAKILNQLGIDMILANSREKDVIQKAINRENVGTYFCTHQNRRRSGIRVWLASGASERGIITLDCPLEKIFRNKKSGVSILGVGVREVSGEFKEGDAIAVLSQTGEKIGLGVAKMPAEEMREILAEKGSKGKVFVHADYLFLL